MLVLKEEVWRRDLFLFFNLSCNFQMMFERTQRLGGEPGENAERIIDGPKGAPW